MRVLIGCEESTVIREAFARLGHEAWSCDLEHAEGNHFQCDVREALASGRWHLFIVHPPCTFICSSGLFRCRGNPEREASKEEALEFVREMMGSPVDKICLENPVGAIGTQIRPADQYVQPYEFGDDASKRTGLWLKNLPPLRKDNRNFVEPRWVCCGQPLDVEKLGKYGCPHCEGDNRPLPRWSNQTDSGQNRLPPSKDRARLRSRTYEGIANAMALQWHTV